MVGSGVGGSGTRFGETVNGSGEGDRDRRIAWDAADSTGGAMIGTAVIDTADDEEDDEDDDEKEDKDDDDDDADDADDGAGVAGAAADVSFVVVVEVDRWF